MYLRNKGEKKKTSRKEISVPCITEMAAHTAIHHWSTWKNSLFGPSAFLHLKLSLYSAQRLRKIDLSIHFGVFCTGLAVAPPVPSPRCEGSDQVFHIHCSVGFRQSQLCPCSACPTQREHSYKQSFHWNSCISVITMVQLFQERQDIKQKPLRQAMFTTGSLLSSKNSVQNVPCHL